MECLQFIELVVFIITVVVVTFLGEFLIKLPDRLMTGLHGFLKMPQVLVRVVITIIMVAAVMVEVID